MFGKRHSFLKEPFKSKVSPFCRYLKISNSVFEASCSLVFSLKSKGDIVLAVR